MTSENAAILIVVGIPLVAVWAYVLVDLIRRREMSPPARLAWAVVCTMLWPAMIAYLLMRPTSGRIDRPEERTDPRALLVAAVLDHEAGRIGDAQFAELTAALRHRA